MLAPPEEPHQHRRRLAFPQLVVVSQWASPSGAFSTSSVTFIKLIGVAMFFGILIDATIVRSVLIRATMRVLGDTNWWASALLRGFFRRYGLREPRRRLPIVILGLLLVGRR